MLVASLLLAAAGLAAAGQALGAQERRGKALYLRGASEADADVVAYLRSADMEVPGSVMPCANCHGRDGRGRPEGGLAPTDITWAQLTRRGSHSHAGGRSHAPYTPQTLRASLVRGVDPDGRALDASMPLYRLSPQGLDALVAYLVRLGEAHDPGLDAARVRLGTVAPSGNPAAREALALWRAYFDDLNAQGGVHGRRVELSALETDPGPSGVVSAVRRLLGEEGVFALLGVFVAEPAEELLSLLDEQELPLVGPFTLFPRRRSPPDRQVFHLVAGVAEQSRALLRHAAARLAPGAARVALVWPEEPGFASAAEEVAAACERDALPLVLRRGERRESFDAARIAAAARAAGAEVVLLLGARGEERALAAAAGAAGWRPYLLLPGYLPGAGALDLPAAFQERVFAGLALPPFDASRGADAQARRLLGRPASAGAAAVRPGAAALAAFRAARVVVEGLRRAGRDLSRDGLVEALEGLYRFDPGVGPPVTFGPNRRAGSPGAHILAIDVERRAFVPVSEWTPAD